MLSILSLSDAPRVPFNIDGRILYSAPGYELVHLTLQPGEAMALHAQLFDVVFYVLSGTGTLQTDADTLEISENTMVHVGKDLRRAWRNEGSKELKILVNKLMEK